MIEWMSVIFKNGERKAYHSQPPDRRFWILPVGKRNFMLADCLAPFGQNLIKNESTLKKCKELAEQILNKEKKDVTRDQTPSYYLRGSIKRRR
jgi:hypothetical protein